MAFQTPKTWASGDKPTSAELNQDIRDNTLAAFPLGVDAWTNFTPTLTQSATVSKTIAYAKYQRVGRWIVANVRLVCTSSGTASNGITVGLPVPAVHVALQPVGIGWVVDISANRNYSGIALLNSSTTLQVAANNDPDVLGGATSLTMTAALVSTDVVGYSIVYEAVS